MRKLRGPRELLPILSVLWLAVSRLEAQSPRPSPSPDDLFLRIASLDRELFDAFNRCDLQRFESFFVDDVEFYHDQTGLTVGRKAVTESVRNNICGKVSRELVSGTLQVYPMHGYGAIEMGVHRFHHPGAEETTPVGEARFVHLWQNSDGAWKITRVLSYDHKALPR